MIVLRLLVAAASSWSLVEKTGDIELYQRELDGERVVELKAVTVSKLSVDALCTAAYGSDKVDPAETEVKLRKLVSNENGVRITYEQVSAPIVNDRDYAVKAVREALPNGGCRTHFEAANEHAPPLPKGFVRIEKLRGGWTFEPMAGGNVVCTYVIFTDPGGSLPAMLIEGTRKKTAVNRVKLMLERAARVADAGK